MVNSLDVVIVTTTTITAIICFRNWALIMPGLTGLWYPSCFRSSWIVFAAYSYTAKNFLPIFGYLFKWLFQLVLHSLFFHLLKTHSVPPLISLFPSLNTHSLPFLNVSCPQTFDETFLLSVVFPSTVSTCPIPCNLFTISGCP